MLDYIKTILKKVSFDSGLFEKELLKAIKSLVGEQIDELKKWCYDNFYKQHKPVLQRCFVDAT